MSRQIGPFALLALLALRIGIGFHFFKEGADKLQNPSWSSEGFLGSAKGYFAPTFHNMVWDVDGLGRMNLEQSALAWGQFKEQVAQRYGFNEAQAQRADAAYQRHVAQLESHLEVHSGDIAEYQQGLARRDQYLREPGRSGVASLHVQIDKIDGELKAKRRELVGPIDQMWKNYEAELLALATPEQRSLGPVTLGRPGRRFMDSKTIDRWIPYFDLTIGLLLMLGLFTRVAATVGAVFLLSVIASQWPGSPGAVPAWPQFVEALGLLVVAATAPIMGSVAGTDFFLGLLRGWCCGTKQGAQS